MKVIAKTGIGIEIMINVKELLKQNKMIYLDGHSSEWQSNKAYRLTHRRKLGAFLALEKQMQLTQTPSKAPVHGSPNPGPQPLRAQGQGTALARDQFYVHCTWAGGLGAGSDVLLSL